MGINIQTIRSSFDLVKPIANDVADRFYQNLFQDYPEAKMLFAAVDMPRQKKALVGALVAAVDNLDNPDTLTRFLLALGERHGRYGVEEFQYDWVGTTLLKTFGEFLGDQWTDDLRRQWAAVYTIITEAMQAGARDAGRRSPKLRDVSAPKENELTMTQERESSASIAEELASDLVLPASLKAQIHRSVETAVIGLIKNEVQRCYNEQMRRIEKMSAAELVRLAG